MGVIETYGDEEDVGTLGQLALDSHSCLGGPFENLELQRGVFLRANTFTFAPVVVHARLAVFDRVNGVPLAELDSVKFFEAVHLPSYECCREQVSID